MIGKSIVESGAGVIEDLGKSAASVIASVEQVGTDQVSVFFTL